MSRHEDFKTKVESATAKIFIQWYNQKTGRNLTLRKKQETPDFIYADEKGEIGVEVTTAHCNQNYAKFTMETARGRRKAPTIQEAIDNPEVMEGHTVWDPEKSLIDFINKHLKEKCAKPYGKNCVLIIRVPFPGLTTDHDFQDVVIPKIELPEHNPFKEVYLTIDQRTYFKLP